MSTMYFVHSVVRGRANRALRAASPAHHRLTQFVGPQQSRLVRGRPVAMTEDVLKSCLDELKKKQAAGILEVRTRDGRLVNLETLTAPAPAPSAPLPNPPLDSAKNDSPHVGEDMPQHQGGLGMQQALGPMGDDSEEAVIPPEFMPDAPAAPTREQKTYRKGGR